MLAVGATIGGIVTELVGIDLALIINGITFLCSFAFLYKLPDLPPSDKKNDTHRGFIEGLRYLRQKPYLASLLSLKSLLAIGAACTALLPIYGNGFFPATAGPFYIGLLYSFRGLGAMTGSLAVRKFSGDAPQTMRLMIIPAFGLVVAANVLLFFAPNIWFAAVSYMIGAVGGGVIWVFSGTLAQMSSDSQYRGRLFSIEFGLHTLMISLVGWLSGAVIDAGLLSMEEVVLCGGFLTGLPIIYWSVINLVIQRKITKQTIKNSPKLTSEQLRIQVRETLKNWIG